MWWGDDGEAVRAFATDYWAQSRWEYEPRRKLPLVTEELFADCQSVERCFRNTTSERWKEEEEVVFIDEKDDPNLLEDPTTFFSNIPDLSPATAVEEKPVVNKNDNNDATQVVMDSVKAVSPFHDYPDSQKEQLLRSLFKCYPNLRTVNLKAVALMTFPQPLCEFSNLKRLFLQRNGLRSLPDEFARLKSLKGLNLAHNLFTHIPQVLTSLDQLRECSMQSNKLKDEVDVPPMTSLRRLNLEKNEISGFVGLEKLTGLKYLWLNDNSFAVSPAGLDSLPSLIHLDMNRCDMFRAKKMEKLMTLKLNKLTNSLWTTEWSTPSLTDLEAKGTGDATHRNLRIFELWSSAMPNLKRLCVTNLLVKWPKDQSQVKWDALRKLELSECSLQQLPESIGNLEKLKLLNLQKNQLTQLPSSIGKLTSLTRLRLGNNSLTELPAEIGSLHHLRWLGLAFNRLSSLPEQLMRLPSLAVLRLRDNRFTSFLDTPSSTFVDGSRPIFPQLFHLHLSNNSIHTLGNGLASCTSLGRLHLSNNMLTEVPQVIFQLTDLTNLFLGCNRLQSIPPAIGKLENMRFLDLSGNELRELPFEIGLLSNVFSIDLSHNRLTTLPVSLSSARHIDTFNLQQNEISVLPVELLGTVYSHFTCEFECNEEAFPSDNDTTAVREVESLVHLAASEYLKDESMKSFITTPKLSPLPQELQEALRASVRLCGNKEVHEEQPRLVFGRTRRKLALVDYRFRMIPCEAVFCSAKCAAIDLAKMYHTKRVEEGLPMWDMLKDRVTETIGN